jgi:hypothetical protein
VRLLSGYWLRLLDIGVGGVATWKTRHDHRINSTYQKPKPGLSCECILVLAWPVGIMARTRLLLAKEVSCGRGKRKWKEPHETKRWTADSEPAARCVGWCEHMACMLKTCTLLLGGPKGFIHLIYRNGPATLVLTCYRNQRGGSIQICKQAHR